MRQCCEYTYIKEPATWLVTVVSLSGLSSKLAQKDHPLLKQPENISSDPTFYVPVKIGLLL